MCAPYFYRRDAEKAEVAQSVSKKEHNVYRWRFIRGCPLGQERNIDPRQRHAAPLERAIIDHSDYKHVAPPEHVGRRRKGMTCCTRPVLTTIQLIAVADRLGDIGLEHAQPTLRYA